MIDSLSLTNFRGILRGELSLSPLTILTGTNNSGKSTILDSLFLAPNPLRAVPYDNYLAVQVVQKLHETLDSEGYAFLFPNYSSDETRISCSFEGKKTTIGFLGDDFGKIWLTGEWALEHAEIISHGNHIRSQVFGWVESRSEETNPLDRITRVIPNTLLFDSRLNKYALEYLRNNWAPTINRGILRKVADEASMMSPESYSDLTLEPFLGKNLAFYAYLKDGRRIRLGDLGEGIESYITSRILYEINKPDVLLWDDIESHFNPRVIYQIGQWFSEVISEKKQIIVATHSLETIRILSGINEEQARVQLLSLQNGRLSSKNLAPKDVMELTNQGIDIRAAENLLI